ncbi:phage head-tail connector protein [Eubacterium sp.]|uniref:phage head-tail connector protein n=1 Tax=Eubacterium sp. TaxID=142586 RepID=UPI002FC85AA1
MIVELAELKGVACFKDATDVVLARKIAAVESAIKGYTHNTFVDRVTGEVFWPPDVVEGAIKLLVYDATTRTKAGIKSESISRHSVTYADGSGTDTGLGYPAELIGFLKPYMKARF